MKEVEYRVVAVVGTCRGGQQDVDDFGMTAGFCLTLDDLDDRLCRFG